jgi:hypothetical protein
VPKVLDPFRFVLIALAGWMKEHQQQAIDYFARRIEFSQTFDGETTEEGPDACVQPTVSGPQLLQLRKGA